MSEHDIRERLERLIDRWLRATPAERAILIHEKLRLEDLLDEVKKTAKSA